ncbi:unnamed protein product [Rotaria magnacalcarata]|uniref:U-box domain-containing protein n=1 Tax=Rotaria magnacalcarata TaxID=392030 RepID=A0A8S2R926_9BILA|nr:unnamed protein product [Rotaria magnacalcarata]CAF4147287.1 unnamed protein product [Rotaria magnacalcarata]
MDSKTKANEDLETLTCPITLQFFRDPVIAADGHAYERVAIVKWIEKHGTSPMTREPLNIADLISDGYLKHLASQRRTSTVSQITQDNSCVIPVISENVSEHSYPADLMAYNRNLTRLKKGTRSNPTIPTDARWVQNAVTVAGGIPGGSGTDQFLWPYGLTIGDNQTIFVADYGNHRIVQWNIDNSFGLVVAGGRGAGNQLNQLNHPIVVLIDKDTSSLIICDYGNRRVLQWSLQSGTTQGEILLDGIFCSGLAIDQQRNIYVSSPETFEVTRYQMGSTNGTVVAGGYGAGVGLNQFSWPTYLFVDLNQNVYVSDMLNNRVMKWSKGAQEGIIVASSSAMKKKLTPRGLFVDTSGTLYVVDAGNQRVLRWLDEPDQGTVIAGGNGVGLQKNQLNSPIGLAFDQQGNMYVADSFNCRIQQFSIE